MEQPPIVSRQGSKVYSLGRYENLPLRVFQINRDREPLLASTSLHLRSSFVIAATQKVDFASNAILGLPSMLVILIVLGIFIVPCDSFHFLRETGGNFEIEAGGFESNPFTGKFGPFVSGGVDPSYEVEMVDLLECAEIFALSACTRGCIQNFCKIHGFKCTI